MLNFHEVLRSLLPRGQAWDLKPLGFFDLTLKGIGDALEDAYEELKKLAHLRDPLTTDFLSDLEKEFGILPPANASEEQRRQNVAAVAFATPGMGIDHLQEKLRSAGFTNVYVYHNNPAIDPNYYLDPSWALVCGHQDAVLGHRDAYCGRKGFDAYLLVNGPTYSPDNGGLYEYTMPAGYSEALNPWHLVFFVGGLRADTESGWFSVEDWDMELVQPENLLLDGDMEAVGVGDWETEDATLSKQTGTRTGGEGVQVLRILSAAGGTASVMPVPDPLQAPPDLGDPHTYHVVGWVRSQSAGTGYPRIRNAVGGTIWTGEHSSDWQYFEEDITVTAAWDLLLEGVSLGAGEYVEFDDVWVVEPSGTEIITGLENWTAGNGAELAKREGGP